MADVQDAVLPILRGLQAEVAGLKSEFVQLKTAIAQNSDVNEALARYITYTVGLHTETKVDLEDLKLNVTGLVERVDRLEKPVA